MTILPNSNKKKPQQGSNANERELNETSGNSSLNHGVASLSHQIANIPSRASSLQVNAESPSHTSRYQSINSASCWNNSAQRDEISNSHRGSNLGSVRPKVRDHRCKGSPPYPSTSTNSNNWGHSHDSKTTLPIDGRPRERQIENVAEDSAADEDYTGYNSGDEYAPFHDWNLTNEQWEEKERNFEKKMKKKNLIIKKMKEDGACLFRAIADQVYGDQDFHAEVRHHCMNYIQRNADAFEPFVSEPFNTYIERKRREDCFGNHVEIAAMSEMYNRVIEVYCYSSDPMNSFQGSLQTDNAAIKISYHRGTHYNSLIDPNKATIGVGLGLPNLQPGLADQNLLHEASKQSEAIHLEQTMLEDKIRATDHEATSDAMQEQIVQQSYLDWLATQNPKAAPQKCPQQYRYHDSEAGTSVQQSTIAPELRSTGESSTSVPCYTSPFEQNELRDFAVAGPSKVKSVSVPPISPIPSQFLDLQDCSNEEASILAQVLALSQQEYLDTLKTSTDSERN